MKLARDCIPTQNLNPELAEIRSWLKFIRHLGRREREREIYFKSHISLWEHSSHFRLIGRGVPSVAIVSQLDVQIPLFGLPQGKSPGSHMKDQESNPLTSHTASGCTTRKGL